MIYVALLRGINVGGKNKIVMNTLKQTFETSGMNDVMTYINTGNIIFSYKDTSITDLSSILETAIYNDFGLQIKVVILSFDDFDRITKSIPDTWKNDKEMKSDVMFLWEAIDDESILKDLTIKPNIDTTIYIPGAILWSIDKSNASRSGMAKIVGSKIYKQITVRNVNTVRKIYNLMENQIDTPN